MACFSPFTAVQLEEKLAILDRDVVVLCAFRRRCGVVVLPMAFRPDADS